MPTVTTDRKPTWKELLLGLDKDLFDDATLVAMADYYKVDPTGLTHEQMVERLYNFVIEHSPDNMGTEAIWPVPAPVEPKAKKPKSDADKWWDALDFEAMTRVLALTALAVAMVALLVSLAGMTRYDDKGVSKEKVTQEVGNDVGFGFDNEGNFVIVEGGKLDNAVDKKFAELMRNECILNVQARNLAASTSVDPNKICK